MRRSSILICVLLLALTLAACGGAKPTTAPAAPAPTAAKPAGQVPAKAAESLAPAVGTEEPEATQEPEETEEPGATEVVAAAVTAAPTDDTLSLSSRDEGLDKLKSYRMRWQAEWKSGESGKEESSNWDWTEEYSSDPQALHWLWKVAGTDVQSKGDWEMWQVGNTSYMSMTGDKEEKTCTSFSSDDKNQQVNKGLFSPNSLGSLSNAKFVGNDTVNGVRAKHYKYDETSAVLGGFGKVNGEIWVAIDGGFVVKDMMNWEGAAGLFGGGANAKGSGKWTWELSDVNQPIAINPPENCGGAAKGLPMMQDASEKASFGDSVMYKTAGKLADVAAFYQKEMAAAGWQPEGEPQVTDEYAMLQFSKDGQKAQVMLTSDQDKTQVMVNISK